MEIPKEWTFKDNNIAGGFDRHVREQLPWYDLATGLMAHIARHYISEGGLVYDIGASTGNVGLAISDTLESRKATLVAIDNAEQMRGQYEGGGKFVVSDADKYDYKQFDLAIVFLTFMFMPPSTRSSFLEKLRAKIKPNGAIIIFDKCVPASGYTASILWRFALAGKLAAGISADEILQKELSLSGVQRPILKKELGDTAVEVFRVGDFAGWIIEYE